MKTAEEILDIIEHKDFYISREQKIRIIKEYAKQVAEEALKDAASKYEGVHMRDSFGCTCDVPSAITSTTIQTP